MTITQADLDRALAAINEATARQFAGLSAKLQPVPVPTPPSTAIRFATHRYNNSGGPKPIVSYYDLQHSTEFKRVDWPSSAEVYRYATTACDRNEPLGIRQALPPGIVGTRVAHNADGTVIRRSSTNPEQLLDISNLGLQSDIAAHLTASVVRDGYEGVYLDEVDHTYAWGYWLAWSPREFPTIGAWQNAMVSLVRTIADRLHSSGKKLWVNYGGDDANPAFRDQIVNAVDGVNIEFFVGLANVGQPTAVGTQFISHLTTLQTIENTLKKPVHAHASTSDQAVVDYAFLAWLLGTEFRGSFTASIDYNGGIIRPSSTLLVQAEKLGNPDGVFRTETAGTVTRDFQNGFLRVNASNASSGTIPPRSGRIILDNG